MNKRSLSTIVTSLIVILLVLVAVGVLYVTYMNFVRTGAEGISLGDFTFNLEIKSVRIDNSTDNISMKIKRNPGQGDLVGIKFIFNDGKNSESSEQTVTLEELGYESFSFTLSELNVSNIKIISIAPIYKISSGKEVIGSIVDSYWIKKWFVEDCIEDCTGKECGDDGCGGSCGDCNGTDVCDGTGQCVPLEECVPETCISLGKECGTWNDDCEGTLDCGDCDVGDSCSNGICVGCTPDCSCASATCIGDTCSDGCSGICAGTLAPDCGIRECGPAPNGCGGSNECGTCGAGEHCESGTCVPDTASCELTNAYWSDESVAAGTEVTLIVEGTNCNGKTVSFEVWEDDLIGDDHVIPNPDDVVFSGSSATGTWTAEWQPDASGDPEYYFIASVESEEIKSSDPLLTVTPAP